MLIRLTISSAMGMLSEIADETARKMANTSKRYLYSAYFKMKKPCQDECQPWYDFLRKDGKYYGPSVGDGEEEPDGTYAINVTQHCSHLDLAMPCQVCNGNKTFGPAYSDEIHSTTQSQEAGLPNDGMLYLITRCRQSGYATPESLDGYPNIWPDKEEQRRVDVGSKCRPEIIGCFDGANCSDIIDKVTGKPYDNDRRPGDGSENVPTNASAIVYGSTFSAPPSRNTSTSASNTTTSATNSSASSSNTSASTSTPTSNAGSSTSNSTPTLPVLPTSANTTAADSTAASNTAPPQPKETDSGALAVSLPLTLVLGALGIASLV
ncbi:hypothetical protein A1Q2_08420 [Trichosporon asahii var. asahii CBS 8904]|uniref:Uncharacterized protein n=1 Tax=Trichosporon asahii var. asahii (strain CBS 8904) TaxID=1220162 RepID=K1VKF4_TRIAC|nr:hypothetical protein A1Q2_08420 [Trichosporon asahii var. asahii CBS 8904]